MGPHRTLSVPRPSVRGMWSLVCSRHQDPPSDALPRVTDTLRALHLLAGRARFWQDWGGSRVETLYDAAGDPAAARLRPLVATGSPLTLHSTVTDDDPDGPSSTLWIDSPPGGPVTVEWAPLDLTGRVLGEPAVARAVLVSLAGIWDADAAAWCRSDVDALPGHAGSGGWMAYRATDAVPDGARRVLRGVLRGPECPAGEYGGAGVGSGRSVGRRAQRHLLSHTG